MSEVLYAVVHENKYQPKGNSVYYDIPGLVSPNLEHIKSNLERLNAASEKWQKRLKEEGKESVVDFELYIVEIRKVESE